MAIYYESGFEPIEGKEAVAQVVLNRVRHPAYPKTVCGVVWEGSERRTGCQFTFTCDGSTSRTPAARQWAESLAVARRSLGGYARADLLTALNYHADYVKPYWSASLKRIQQIGRHIFYAPKRTAVAVAPASAAAPATALPSPARATVWGIALEKAGGS